MGIKGLINGILISLIIWSLILTFLLTGCSIYPLKPETAKDYKDFHQFIDTMGSPEDVSKWIKKHTKHDKKHAHGKSAGTDGVERNARYLFEKRRGACLQQACLFVLVNRLNGYASGIVFLFPKAEGPAHARSWFIGKSGKISMTNNGKISRDVYDSLKQMFDIYDEADKPLVVYDSKMEEILYSFWKKQLRK